MKIIPRIMAVTLLVIFAGFLSVAQIPVKKIPAKKIKNPTTATTTPTSGIVVPSNCPCTFPSINFEGDDAKLTDRAKSILKATAETVKQNPNSLVFVSAFGISSKSGQNNCNKKLDRIRTYLFEVEGLRIDRIIVNCEFDEDIRRSLTVTLTCE